jgi:signal recognition particle receptor subunit beta
MSGGEISDLEVSDEAPIEGSSSPSPPARARPDNNKSVGYGSVRDRYYGAARLALAPFLPPPANRAIEGTLDPWLRPYAGEEGTAKVALSALAAYLAFAAARWLASGSSSSSRSRRRRGKAILDEPNDDEDALGSEAPYSETVLICGPSLSGKTRLFYHLLYGDNVDTVASLAANVAVVDRTRYMDFPGTSKLGSAQLEPVLKGRPRIVLVLDSTQPVAGAADCLHQLFSYYHSNSGKLGSRSNQSSSSSQRQEPLVPTILILCHKSDLPTAKSAKRIQLQLRGELERLIKSSSAKAAASSSSAAPSAPTQPWWPVGEPIDFDRIRFVRVAAFRSTTCEGRGCREAVGEFCRTGVLPPDVGPAAAAPR